MKTLEQVKHLLYKDLVLEWRSKYAINGILLYVVSTIFVCYQAFRSIEPTTWNVLFWIILLFASINAISKSFIQESPARQLYYYSLVSAKAVILSKMIYNSLLMTVLAGLALTVYTVIFGNPLADPFLYLIAVLLGAISFAAVFTMVSGISAKAGHNTTLMSVLSFPIIIPLLIILIELSGNAMDGSPRSESYPELMVLLAINIISVAISLLLFPYLWRE
ncbi:MAG TPA: heme exporter protein CcmB [Sphingobacteriaceae bacterium]|nr:heme exporter protein CcmB [Sphingobacteriaceae bacterium]